MSWAPHGFDVSRRSFFTTIAGVLGMGTNVPTLGTQKVAPGFYVTGVISPTEDGDFFDIGHEFGLRASPTTEPHRLLRSYVNQKVQVHVELA